MESYQYLNNKTELTTNPNKFFLPFNKNLQIQNFFRGDSNIYKQKNKIYNLNNKKEIHFTSRQKENEIGIKGPKIITINFPPEFMISANSSRKNSSHEKNIYQQQNIINNIEINDIGNTDKNYASTMNKEFQKFNQKKDKNDIINYKKIGQKFIGILPSKEKSTFMKINRKEHNYNMKKNNKFDEGEYTKAALLSDSNIGYIHSEAELNSGRNISSKEKDLEKEDDKNIKLGTNNLRTEGSDYEMHKYTPSGTTAQTNYKSNSYINIEKPLNNYLNNHQQNKTSYNLDYENHLYYSNTPNNSDNSREKRLNNYSLGNKNAFIKGNINNKLVFNPSNITNRRMKENGSESELSALYLASINGAKGVNNHLKYYKHINELYNNNNSYNQNKSENHSIFSSSQDKNSNSQSREKSHIKTQTDFDNRPNYYESLLNNLEKRRLKGQKNILNVKSAEEYNKDILKNLNIIKKIENINIGIAYKIQNGYKFYFNIPNEQLYILKEVNYTYGKGLIQQIENWNKKYQNDNVYLKIYDHEINFNQRQIIWIMQYPTGGESINDIINSVGFYDQNYLFDLVTKIYKAIIKLKFDKEGDKYRNIPFCLCDVFINVNEHIKIIPPLIRKIPIDANIDKKSKYNYKVSPCKCKTELLKILSYINEDSYSFFCLGFFIIQIITQNLIFEMSSFIYTLKLMKKSKNIIMEENCCFIHLLLNIETKYFNNSKYLLFSNFLNLYPKSLLSLLHECTSFSSNNTPSTSNEFLNLYDTNKNLNLSIKEILEITTLSKNNYIKLNTFLSDFELLFKDIKINKETFIHKLNSNKIIHVLSRALGIDKENLMNKIKEKIDINVIDKDDKDDKDENEKRAYFNNENFSCLFIGINKKKNEINSENIFNKQNHSHLSHDYRLSDNF